MTTETKAGKRSESAEVGRFRVVKSSDPDLVYPGYPWAIVTIDEGEWAAESQATKKEAIRAAEDLELQAEGNDLSGQVYTQQLYMEGRTSKPGYEWTKEDVKKMKIIASLLREIAYPSAPSDGG